MTIESSHNAGLLDDPSVSHCRFTLTLAERLEYIKVTDIARLTARAAHPCDEDRPSLRYLQAVLADINSVDQDARDGTLPLIDPITLRVQSYEIARQTVGRGQQCLVHWADFVKFARRLGIEVVVKDALSGTTGPAKQNADVTPTDPITNARQRSDALAPVIDDVVAALESSGRQVTPASVLIGLQALKGGNTCVDDIASDGSIIWKGANGSEKLSKDALKARLQRLVKLRKKSSPNKPVKGR